MQETDNETCEHQDGDKSYLPLIVLMLSTLVAGGYTMYAGTISIGQTVFLFFFSLFTALAIRYKDNHKKPLPVWIEVLPTMTLLCGGMPIISRVDTGQWWTDIFHSLGIISIGLFFVSAALLAISKYYD